MSESDSLKRFEAALNKYCATSTVRKLALGCGDNALSGWFNTDLNEKLPDDIYCVDMSKPLPIKDDTFDYIELEHNIEHLTYRQGVKLINECYRILKDGGTIRIVTPDLRRLVSIYLSNIDKSEEYQEWMMDDFINDTPSSKKCIPAMVFNNSVRAWGHKFIYDEATLQSVMTNAGFVSIKRYETGNSDDENLLDIERHLRDQPELQVYNKLETMALEGTK